MHRVARQKERQNLSDAIIAKCVWMLDAATETEQISTSTETPASIRQGGPGSSHEKAKRPLEIKKPPADSDGRRRSQVPGGGGEQDAHHEKDADAKGCGR